MTSPPDVDDVPDFLHLSPSGQAILALLRAGVSEARVTDIGRYRGTWTAAQVRWAKRHYIQNNPHTGEWNPPWLSPPPGRAATGRPVTLSPRQAMVLDGMCRGLTAHQIATESGLAVNTVQHHVRGTIRAIGARDHLGAVAIATSGRVQLFIAGDRRSRPHHLRRAS